MDFEEFFGDEGPPRDDYVSILEHWANCRADQVSFCFTDVESVELCYTFAQLWEEVRALAGYLQGKCRIRPGDRVLLLYPPCIDFITGFFACHAIGAIAVPAFPPRSNRKASRIRSIVVDADAKWALTTGQIAERLTGKTWHEDLVGVQILGTDDPACRDPARYRRPTIDSDSLAVLQYTSGSTGSPKGVMLTQGNLVANAELIWHGFEPPKQPIGLSWLPTYHDMGLVGGILMPLFMGATNIQMSPMTFLQRPVRWLQAITKYNVNITGGPNFAYQLCVDKIDSHELEGLDLSKLAIAFNGAEPIRAATLEAFARRFEPVGFKRSASLPCYGMAETTLIVTGGPSTSRPVIETFDRCALDEKQVQVGDESDSGSTRKLVGCGAVLPGETVLIVDPDTREPVEGDRIGEIWVQSPSVGAGYYQRKEATEQTFKAHTADGRGPFLRTGDLGFLFNGQLYVSGRLKDMIIVRGVNRYPQDIEETVESASEVVQAGAVAAFAMDHDGREQLAVVAETVRVRDVDWDAEIQAIRRSVTQEHDLPPDAVFLVRNSSVPKTSSGKIQRHACLHAVRDGELKLIAKWVRWEENSPGGLTGGGVAMMQAASASSHEARITDADVNPLIVAAIQQQVRNVAGERANQLSLETNIVLDLGLDSLERLEIARNLEKTFGGRFPEQVLDEIESIGQIALAIARYLPPGADERAQAMLSGGGETSSQASLDLRPMTPQARVEPESSVEEFAEYRRLKATMAQMQMTGVPNPYFTVHESVVGDTTVVNGKELISFASYNYLGLSGHPNVSGAAADSVHQYGTSVSASRLVSGEKPIHGELERTLAEWIGVDAAILMVGGHATNETTIGHLVGEGDLILHDALAHNSIVQGALLSGARRRPFPHNDHEALDRILDEVRANYRRVLIVIEGVYSMDGDYSDVPAFVEVKKRHGAMLMVDEAHSFGTMGECGRGMAEFWDVDARDIDIWMGTLSKSAASCGGYIAGSNALIELLRYTAPGFVFSVGMPPAQVAAALAAIETLRHEPDRVERLRERSQLFLNLCKEAGLDTGASEGTPVVPVITGNSMVALRLSNRLKADGINVQPILYPAVEESSARLRFFITSEHSEQQIRYTVERTAVHLGELGFSTAASA
ncbi:MAG: aminotransferase class I/II-fold pyridoxal phosphate-dependent enzyme [Planctomycetota bacterium]